MKKRSVGEAGGIPYWNQLTRRGMRGVKRELSIRGRGSPDCSSPGNAHQLSGHHKTAPNTYFPVSNLQFSSMFHRFSLNSKNPVSKQASHLPRTSQNSLRYLVPGLQYLIFIGFPSNFNDSQASSRQVASAGAAKRKQSARPSVRMSEGVLDLAPSGNPP